MGKGAVGVLMAVLTKPTICISLLFSSLACASLPPTPTPESPIAACMIGITSLERNRTYERVLIVGEHSTSEWNCVMLDRDGRPTYNIPKSKISQTQCPKGFTLGVGSIVIDASSRDGKGND
jgi:hypothetical protein